MTALQTQVGGNHYKKLAIQPIEYCHRNGLGACETLAIRYVTRWKDKGGIQDLEKAIHCIQLLIEMEGHEPEPEPEELKQYSLREIDDLIKTLNELGATLPATDFGPMTEEEEELRFDEVIQARQDIDQQALNNAYLEPIVRGDCGMAEVDTYNGEHD